MPKKLPKTSPERYRKEMGYHYEILELLKAKGPLTIKEIAEAMGLPSQEVMLYVMGMLRYGLVKEFPKDRRALYWKYGVGEA